MPLGRKFRHEYKFLINTHDYYLLRERLKNIMQLDPHVGENGEYKIRSLYFDDVYNTALYEKNAGVYEREKFRIRIYDDSDKVIKLERKAKRGSYINKESDTLTKDEFYSIMNGDLDFLLKKEKNISKLFYCKSKINLLKPAVIVDYIREPYVFSVGNTRVTFDKYLKAGLPSRNIFDSDIFTISTEINNEMILEVKYNNVLPNVIRDALKVKSSMVAASKYVLCREALIDYNLKGC